MQSVRDAEIDPVSLREIAVPAALPCGHVLELGTLRQLHAHGHDRCPLCRARFPSYLLGGYQIFVRHHLSGAVRTFDVQADDTVDQLFAQIAARWGVDSVSAVLVFRGLNLHWLADVRTLYHWGIGKETTVDLFLKR